MCLWSPVTCSISLTSMFLLSCQMTVKTPNTNSSTTICCQLVNHSLSYMPWLVFHLPSWGSKNHLSIENSKCCYESSGTNRLRQMMKSSKTISVRSHLWFISDKPWITNLSVWLSLESTFSCTSKCNKISLNNSSLTTLIQTRTEIWSSEVQDKWKPKTRKTNDPYAELIKSRSILKESSSPRN